jgi:hypothetical protein
VEGDGLDLTSWDKIQWYAFITTAMNVQVQSDTGKFFNSWAITNSYQVLCSTQLIHNAHDRFSG